MTLDRRSLTLAQVGPRCRCSNGGRQGAAKKRFGHRCGQCTGERAQEDSSRDKHGEILVVVGRFPGIASAVRVRVCLPVFTTFGSF